MSDLDRLLAVIARAVHDSGCNWAPIEPADLAALADAILEAGSEKTADAVRARLQRGGIHCARAGWLWVVAPVGSSAPSAGIGFGADDDPPTEADYLGPAPLWGAHAGWCASPAEVP